MTVNSTITILGPDQSTPWGPLDDYETHDVDHTGHNVLTEAERLDVEAYLARCEYPSVNPDAPRVFQPAQAPAPQRAVVLDGRRPQPPVSQRTAAQDLEARRNYRRSYVAKSVQIVRGGAH